MAPSLELFRCIKVLVTLVTLAASVLWRRPGRLPTCSESALQWSQLGLVWKIMVQTGAGKWTEWNESPLSCVFQRAVVQWHHEGLQQSARLPRQELQIPRAFYSKCRTCCLDKYILNKINIEILGRSTNVLSKLISCEITANQRAVLELGRINNNLIWTLTWFYWIMVLVIDPLMLIQVRCDADSICFWIMTFRHWGVQRPERLIPKNTKQQWSFWCFLRGNWPFECSDSKFLSSHERWCMMLFLLVFVILVILSWNQQLLVIWGRRADAASACSNKSWPVGGGRCL